MEKEIKAPIIIAEVGCNHMGDFEIACKMINIAKTFCEVDYVKFQKRCPKELLSEEQYNFPHPEPHNSYGATYGEHREFLELSIEEHAQLKRFCENTKIGYSCSVWDITSLKQIMELEPDYIKIPSAMNTHWEMLEYCCNHYSGKIHISLGMTTKNEEDRIIGFFKEKDRLQDLVVYHCTSGYPVPPKDINLLEITRLVDKYGDIVDMLCCSF